MPIHFRHLDITKPHLPDTSPHYFAYAFGRWHIELFRAGYILIYGADLFITHTSHYYFRLSSIRVLPAGQLILYRRIIAGNMFAAFLGI